MIISVKPVYGNGWTDGHTDVPEPEQFEAVVERGNNGEFYGNISSCAEPMLLGRVFEAIPRHIDKNGIYNCSISSQDERTIIGYCQISLLSNHA